MRSSLSPAVIEKSMALKPAGTRWLVALNVVLVVKSVLPVSTAVTVSAPPADEATLILPFVTGAASGMGAASAKLFAAEGAKVAVVDVNGEGAEKVAADIRAAGGDAIGVACDLTDEAQVKAAVKFIEGTYGPCNALFNHAGGLVVKDFLKISLKEWYGLSTL